MSLSLCLSQILATASLTSLRRLIMTFVYQTGLKCWTCIPVWAWGFKFYPWNLNKRFGRQNLHHIHRQCLGKKIFKNHGGKREKRSNLARRNPISSLGGGWQNFRHVNNFSEFKIQFHSLFSPCLSSFLVPFLSSVLDGLTQSSPSLLCFERGSTKHWREHLAYSIKA